MVILTALAVVYSVSLWGATPDLNGYPPQTKVLIAAMASKASILLRFSLVSLLAVMFHLCMLLTIKAGTSYFWLTEYVNYCATG